MAVSVKNISTGLFFSLSGTGCAGVSFSFSETVKMIFEPENSGLMAKAIISPCVSRIVAPSNLLKDTLCHFLFISMTHLVKYLSFLEEKCCMPHLAWNSSDRTAISPDQGNNRYASHLSQRYSWPLFSWNSTGYLWVCLQGTETPADLCFTKPRNWGLMAKVFSPVKDG